MSNCTAEIDKQWKLINAPMLTTAQITQIAQGSIDAAIKRIEERIDALETRLNAMEHANET